MDEKNNVNFMKKSILIIILCVFLTSLLGVFMVGNEVEAAQSSSWDDIIQGKVCPADCKQVGKAPQINKNDKFIRLQVEIPGVTYKCSYTVKNLKGELEIKYCHYIKSDLPYYIKKIYSFSIGVIAIIAVIMIMIGGLTWIFAAGNPSQIGKARSQITAAVAGLILALCSYAILNLINPDLTTLRELEVNPIEKIDIKSNWCDKLPIKIKWQTTIIKGQTEGNKTSNLNFDGLKCGIQYEYGYEDGGKFNSMGYCSGSKGCGVNNSGSCANTGNGIFCINQKAFCESYDKSKCDIADSIIREAVPWNGGYGCAFQKRVGFLGDWLVADRCVYGGVLLCNFSTSVQISCEDELAENKCWKYEQETVGGVNIKTKVSKFKEDKEDKEYQYCVNLNDKVRPIEGVGYICCKIQSIDSIGANIDKGCATGEYKVNTCDDYYSKYECGLDRCDIKALYPGGCVWDDSLSKCRKRN